MVAVHGDSRVEDAISRISTVESYPVLSTKFCTLQQFTDCIAVRYIIYIYMSIWARQIIKPTPINLRSFGLSLKSHPLRVTSSKTLIFETISLLFMLGNVSKVLISANGQH